MTDISKFIVLSVVIAFLVFVSNGCLNKEDDNKCIERIVTVKKKPLKRLAKITGILKSGTVESYFAPARGTITLLSAEGSEVSTGDVIVKIETYTIDIELQLVKNALGIMEQQRIETTYKNLIKACKYERAVGLEEAKLKVAETKLEQKRVTIDATEVTSLEREIVNAKKKLERIALEISEKEPFVSKGFVSKEGIDDLKHSLETGRLQKDISQKSLKLVNKGTPYDLLLNAEMEVQLAISAVNKAKIKLARFKEVREVDLKKYKIRIDNLIKDKVRLEKTKSKMIYKALSSGIVSRGRIWKPGGRVKIDIGELVGSGQEIVQISKPDNLEIEMNLHESIGSQISTGCYVEFRPLAMPDKMFTGNIFSIKRVATFQQWDMFKTKWIAARASINNMTPTLKTGMSVLADIHIDERIALMVPTEAISDTSTVQLESGQSVTVVCGENTYRETEIIKGLKEGQKLVTSMPPLYPSTVSRKIHRVENGTISSKVKANGELVPGHETPVSVRLMVEGVAKLNSIAKEGDQVNTGDTIAVLDNISATNTLREQKLAHKVAIKEMNLVNQRGKLELDNLSHHRALAQLDRKIAELSRNILTETNPHLLEEHRLQLLMVNKELEGLLRQLNVKKEMSKRGYASDKEVTTLLEQMANVEKRRDVATLRLQLTRQGPTKLERAREELLVKTTLLAEEMAAKTLELTKDKLKIQKVRASLAVEQAAMSQELYESCVAAATVTAPVTGVIMLGEHHSSNGPVKYRAGDSVNRGGSFMTITRFDGFYIKGWIAEEYIEQIHVGQHVEFYLPAKPERRYKGKVKDIGSTAITKSIRSGVSRQVFKIKIEALESSGRFQPQMAVKLEVVTKVCENLPLVPLSFLYTNENGTYVELTNGEKRPVQIKGYDEDYAAITMGVKAGEELCGDIEASRE